MHKSVAMLIATLGGVGNLPKAPGTFGTLATLPLCYLVLTWGLFSHIAVLVLVTVVGTWAADVAAREMGNKDPAAVVVDESAGMLLTMVAAPQGWLWLGLGFVLFRVFDIWKPWPVGWLDHNLDGGWGIMADDLAAGGYALVILHFISWGMG